MLLNLQPIIIVTETQIKYGMGFYQIKKNILFLHHASHDHLYKYFIEEHLYALTS